VVVEKWMIDKVADAVDNIAKPELKVVNRTLAMAVVLVTHEIYLLAAKRAAR
jgi:hypothetical protein